jgi:hypothetical protein
LRPEALLGLKQLEFVGKGRSHRLPHHRVNFLATVDSIEHIVFLSHGPAKFAFERVRLITPVTVVSSIISLLVEWSVCNEFKPLAIIKADAIFGQVPAQRSRAFVGT